MYSFFIFPIIFLAILLFFWVCCYARRRVLLARAQAAAAEAQANGGQQQGNSRYYVPSAADLHGSGQTETGQARGDVVTGVPIAQAVVIAGSVNAGNGSMTAGQGRIPHSQRGSAVVIPNSSPARPVALSVAIEDDEDLPKGEMVGLPFSMAMGMGSSSNNSNPNAGESVEYGMEMGELRGREAATGDGNGSSGGGAVNGSAGGGGSNGRAV